MAVPGVPTQIIDPRSTWASPQAYDRTAAALGRQFVRNFGKYADCAGAPQAAGVLA